MAPARLETRLLVVDDDSLLRELLGHLLQDTEFQLTALSSGEAALRFLREARVGTDAILIDLQMPGESGSALSPAFREAAPSALLMGMSARTPRAEESAAFDAFLLKPFTVESVREALQAAARSRERYARKRTESDPQPPLSASGTGASAGPGIPPGSEMPGGRSAAEGAGVLDPGILTKLQAAIGAAQLRQLYEMTANDVESRLERMRRSLAAGDQKTLREEAHAIKGGCAMVGALELSRLAAKAEVSSETDSHDLLEIFEACFRLRRMITIVSP